MARLKKKILIFGYDFPNITFDAVVHFTNIFYILIAFPSRYSEHVLIQLINLPRNRDPIVTFRTCFVSRKRTGWKKACYRSDRAAAEFVDCVGRAMKEDFVKDILNARYYSILTDGSTDASILEQEVLYILFLSSSWVPVLKSLSVDTPQHIGITPEFKVGKYECWRCSRKYWHSQWVRG